MEGNSPEKPSSKLTRRALFRTAGAGVALAATSSPLATTLIRLQNIKLPESTSSVTEDNQEQTQHASIPEKPIILKDQIEAFFLASFDEKGKIKAKDRIGFTRKAYLEPDLENFKKYAQAISKFQPQIHDAAELLRLKGNNINPLWETMMMGLILVESTGDPKRRGQDGEIGLTQIKPENISELLDELEWGTVDPESVDKNITLGFAQLTRMLKLFPEPSLALWGYNDGERVVAHSVFDYVDKNSDIQHKSIVAKTSGLVRNFKITAEDLNYGKTYPYDLVGATLAILDATGSNPNPQTRV